MRLPLAFPSPTVGVGRSFATDSRRLSPPWPCSPRPVASLRVGVGKSLTLSGSESPGVLPPFVSRPIGVGSSAIAPAVVSPKPLPFLPFAFSRSRRARIVSASDSNWFALGVGSNEEEAFAAVWGAEVGCSKASPPCVVPRFGQVTLDDPEPSSNESADVLHNDDSGSKCANGSKELEPKAAAGADSNASTETSVADVLARETAGEDSDGLHVGPVDALDVSVVGDVPVAFEDLVAGLLAAVRVVLGLPGGAQAGSAFQAEVEASAAGE